MAVKRQKIKRVTRISLPTPGRVSGRARETIAHLEKGWLPVNAELLTGIQANLKNGHYEATPEAFLQDLQKDPALFFTVCKQLRPFSNINAAGFDPIELLEKLEDEQVQKVFNFDPDQFSEHRYWEISPSQELINDVSRIGAESAETLADELGFNTHTAQEGTLFRQLGHHLLAWNYPKLFSQALSTHRTKKEDFDKLLQNYFDISPQQIGARFARELEMSRDIRQTLIPSPDRAFEPGQNIRESFRLTDVCKLSELYAKASEPTSFPEAEIEWAAKESILKPVIGEEVFREMDEKKKNIEEEEYIGATDFGDLDEYVTRVDPAAMVQGIAIPETNKHLANCDSTVQQAFLNIYRELDRSDTALNAIRLLIQRAIPQTEILRGCLYLQRKKDYTLQAALRFGEVSLPRYQKFLFDARNGIIDSLHSQAPFTREGTSVLGDQVVQVRGGMGPDGPPGVLYLEIDPRQVKKSDYNPILMFHIIRGALHDCLKTLEDSEKSQMSFY